MSNAVISLVDGQINISETVASAEVISITGQKIATAKNISTIAAPKTNGVYIVTVVDKNGAKKVQKITVNQ
jgi:5S rRNA maturation endonuclease (ribonuclease M5)